MGAGRCGNIVQPAKIIIIIIINGGRPEKFNVLKGPSECTLVLLVRVDLTQGKGLESESSSIMVSGHLEVSSRGNTPSVWAECGGWREAKYSSELYLKIQSVPRSKHTPSRL
jgi:hypothetical protein